MALLTPGLARDVRLKSEAALSTELLKDPANSKLAKKDFALASEFVECRNRKVRNERYEEFKRRQTDPTRAARDKETRGNFYPRTDGRKVLETAAATKISRCIRSSQ